MIIGDSNFAIESLITQAYSNISIRGIGYFVIYLQNTRYGICEKEATALACSFDSVKERIQMRGKHIIAPEFLNNKGIEIAKIVKSVLYDEVDIHYDCLGLSVEKLSDFIHHNKLLWAPDGDEAFNDGSNILQFDVGAEVRLIGYRRDEYNEIDINSFHDISMSSDIFYDILNKWHNDFITEWNSLPKKSID